MAKVLVTGVDTTIGANLALSLAENFECVGLYHARPVRPAGCVTIGCDHFCPGSLTSAIRTVAPDWVVYCHMLSHGSWDAPSTPVSEATVVRHLADEACRENLALTVISTDAVYAGPRLFYEESAPTTAQSDHAVEARKLEEVLRGSQALLVRTHAYGWSPTEDSSMFAQSLADRLRNGQDVALDGVRYATPILATDLAELLLRAYELRLRGLYHITGAERTNPDRFARELAFALGIENYQSCGQQPLGIEPASKAPVIETSLNTRRARRDLGHPMPLLREGLARFAAQAVSGHLDLLRAGAPLAETANLAA